MKKKMTLCIATAVLSPVIIICLLMAGLCSAGSTGNYQLHEDIESISYAQIANVTYEGYIVDNINVLDELSQDDARELAHKLCSLECRYINPPEYDVESISAIFYYSDGNFEIISQKSNRNIVDGSTRYGHLVFDEDEFKALLMSAANISSYDGILYRIDDKGAHVCGCDKSLANGVIMPEVDGSRVLSVDKNAFYGCEGLDSIVIPDGIERIGSCAFCECGGLTDIVIPDSVTEIGECAFMRCTGLKKATLSKNLSQIPQGLFAQCHGLVSVTIPDSVTEIGEKSFYECSTLRSITIPDSVTRITGDAFSDCTSLTDIVLSENITRLGDSCLFAGCKSLEGITIPENVTDLGRYTFCGCESLKSITISENVKSIYDSVFKRCVSLESVELPDGLQGIYKFAFEDCKSLSYLTVPDSVTDISPDAFVGCDITIRCSKGSYAWEYCRQNSIRTDTIDN